MLTELPEWANILVDWAVDEGKKPLDFHGVEVPTAVQFVLGQAFGQPQTLEQMEQEVYEVNLKNGWFEDARTFGDDCARLHTEISEMFDAYRDHGYEDATKTVRYVGRDILTETNPVPIENPKPEGVGSEVADVLIRLLDTCRRRGIDLRAEYERKVAFNRTRGYKHGGRSI